MIIKARGARKYLKELLPSRIAVSSLPSLLNVMTALELFAIRRTFPLIPTKWFEFNGIWIKVETRMSKYGIEIEDRTM